MRPRLNLPGRSDCKLDLPAGRALENPAQTSCRKHADFRLITPEHFRKHLSGACKWILEQERLILKNGISLTAAQLRDARLAGVAEPGRIRLLRVRFIPMSTHPLLSAAAEAMGLNTSLTPCLAVRHGIFISSKYWGQRWWVAHELAHTAQYELLGIRAFIECYLYQCLAVGYPSAPMEREAIAVAERVCGAAPFCRVPNTRRPLTASAKFPTKSWRAVR